MYVLLSLYIYVLYVLLNNNNNNRFLASCGKDRSICIHMQEDISNTSNTTTNTNTFVSIICVKNAHKRIIWDAR
jgi:hypothetical protein